MKRIAVALNYSPYLKDNIFRTFNYADKHLCDYFQLIKKNVESRGDEIHTLDVYDNNDDIDIIIYVDFPMYPKIKDFKNRLKNSVKSLKYLYTGATSKRILYIWESPALNKQNWKNKNYKYFDYILSYSPIASEKYIYFQYTVSANTENIKYNDITINLYKTKKLCCMVASNKSSRIKNSGYKFRYNVIRYFENINDEFDLYGFGWESNYGILSLLKSIFRGKKYVFNQPKNYKGVISEKIELYSNYKFVFAIENLLDYKGYVTEKLIEVLLSESVPIYNGENIIGCQIPDDIYIDINKFSNLDELYKFIKLMDYETYFSYIYRKMRYIQSDEFKCFLHQNNVEKMIDIIYSRSSTNK